MTIDYIHILSFDPILHGGKQSNAAPSLVYRVKIPGCSCDYGPGVTAPRPLIIVILKFALIA